MSISGSQKTQQNKVLSHLRSWGTFEIAKKKKKPFILTLLHS